MLQQVFRALTALPLVALPLLACACGDNRIQSAFVGTYQAAYTGEDGTCYPGGRPIPDGQGPTANITVAVSLDAGDVSTGTVAFGLLGGAPACTVTCRFTSQTQVVVDSFDACAAFLGLPVTAGTSKGQIDVLPATSADNQHVKVAVSWSNAPGAACTMNDGWLGK